jgi:hypothetical protein
MLNLVNFSLGNRQDRLLPVELNIWQVVFFCWETLTGEVPERSLGARPRIKGGRPEPRMAMAPRPSQQLQFSDYVTVGHGSQSKMPNYF